MTTRKHHTPTADTFPNKQIPAEWNIIKKKFLSPFDLIAEKMDKNLEGNLSETKIRMRVQSARVFSLLSRSML